VVTGNIQFTNETGGNTQIYVNNLVDGSFNASDELYDDSSTLIGIPSSVNNLNYITEEGGNTLYGFDLTNYPMNGSEIEILHTSGLYYPYAVVTVSDTGTSIPTAKVAALCDSTNTTIRAKIWRFDLSSGVQTGAAGIQEDILFGTFGNYRDKSSFLIEGIPADLSTRPSTALIFDEQETRVYRTISFENTIVGSTPTPVDVTKVTIDTNFDDVNLLVDNDRAADANVDSNPGTMGATVGDTMVAVNLLEGTDPARINTGNMLFSWNGVVHRITDYTVESDIDGDFGVIRFTDVYSINDSYTSGLSLRVDNLIGDQNSLRATLDANETGSITVNISTCRATGHDFLFIGTGGYNNSNYPNRTFGSPINNWVTSEESIDENGTSAKAQVQERIKGRVFFASTDQDGFFRVGRFFTVDQGTGSVTFNAALVLTNIDGIGFKRGVRVNEFSADDSFTNAQGDAAPTETAVEGYINRRLGWDRNGNSITLGDIIGGGAVRKAGDTLTGNINMGGNLLTNVGSPTSGTDAANKNYVDNAVQQYDSITELADTDINGTNAIGNNQLLVYQTGTNLWINAAFDSLVANSDFTIVYNSGSGKLEGQITAGAILNADVSASAAIAQSKLNMNAATTRANATGISQGDLGLSSFDSANFTATNGWINITATSITNAQLAGSIANNKLANSTITVSDGTSSTAVALGGTINFAGTANEVELDEAAGTITIGLPSTINVNALTATTATNSNNSVVAARNSENATHYIMFVTGTNGNLPLYSDTGLTWNPSTDTLGLSSGDITGLNTLTFAGGTGTNEVIIPDNLADALSIRNAGGDFMVFTTTNGSENLSISSAITVTGNVVPQTNNPTDSGQMLGLSTNRWNTVYATVFNGVATEALYADLAENYLGDDQYEPGTVVVFGGTEEITITSLKGDKRVAGVVTTNPAHLMNSHLKGEHVTGIALQGRVPCKVLGRVQKGDLLVTSSIPGYAIVDN
jgi:hypothetical protein